MSNNALNVSNASNASFYQTTNSSTSTLRPRNNRLISYEDNSDPFQSSSTVAKTTSASSTPHDSRSISPSITGSASRARSKGKQIPTHVLRESGNHKRNASENVDFQRRSSSGLWDSWSSIQGIASTFLGSDVATSGPVKRANSTNVRKSSGRMIQDKGYNPRQTQPEWGPKSKQPESKPTSIEDQRALLQAKRREILLLQSVNVEAGQDSLGRYKRKDSNASIRSPIDCANFDNDVLVYRHKVQLRDTMAGVLIKYSCQPEAFRKANRFWPNDNIQRKKWVVVPVDACGVRGRKTEAPYVETLLTEDTAQSNTNVSQPISTSDPQDVEPFPPAETTTARQTEEDTEYRHDSWVLLPNNPQPIEILRISKSALGYFPPARRKSPSRSQPPTPFTDSTTSTPKSSFDMLRHPPSHAAQQAQLHHQLAGLSVNTNHSPIRSQASIPRHLSGANSSRTRSTSTVSAPNGPSSTNNQNTFLSALTGPGGVGTLRGLRTERARPGPGDDSLNKKFAGYFPEFLPPDHPDYQGPGTTGNNALLRPPHGRTASNSLRTTPRASIDSIRSTRSNSSSVPAAIAGWVGKVASANSPKGLRKKGDLRLGLDRGDLMAPLAGIGEDGGDGDLIELSDTPDEVSRQLHDAVADGDEHAVDGDGDDRTPIATPTVVGVADGRSEEELMNERFPVRGRVRRAYEAH